MTKQEMRTEATKKAILDVAELEFSEKGLAGSRVDVIAAKAQVNKALIYRHFGSKEELYKEILVRVYMRLRDIEDSVISYKTDYVVKLKHIVRVYFEFLYDNPSFVRMVMWENLNDARYFKELGMQHIKDPIINELSGIIRQASEQGRISESIDSDQLIMTLIACSFNYFSNMKTLTNIVNKDLSQRENMEKRIQATTEMLLSYMEVL
ncbi:MAG: TetR/AcrR family transcriptional regulator [Sphaerochaeta sp.]|nr:TetR/AcrR family transcriptional regulator [Sphaerochaeta sp.]